MPSVFFKVDTQNGKTYRISRSSLLRQYPHLAPAVKKLSHKGDYSSEGKGTPDKRYRGDGLRYITRLTSSGSKKRRRKTRKSPTSIYDFRTPAAARATTRRWAEKPKKRTTKKRTRRRKGMRAIRGSTSRRSR